MVPLNLHVDDSFVHLYFCGDDDDEFNEDGDGGAYHAHFNGAYDV